MSWINTIWARLPLLLTIACLSFASSASASSREPVGEAELHELFSRGKASFRQGLDLFSRGDRDGGEILIREAAAHFQAILGRGGIENGYLHYNLGNCYFWLGDLGRAIANYRRAEKTIPTDADLRQNLFAARQKCRDRFIKTTESRLLETLFFWHFAFPLRWKMQWALAVFLMVWVLMTVNLFARRKSLRVIAVLVAVFFAVLAVSGGIDFVNGSSSGGVVVAEECIARKGDGESYEPAFEEPLHAGTEYEQSEVRGSWVEIRLLDGRQCWVKSSEVEAI